ncbi:helix-turn-helix domain-containing protein [Ottowia sp. VDI28]|uniref:helix-turn-helix domain-containing protein n=1 Tax=Ottowia sp. VDI28 TaxID=3133968 RepID=UPI003C2FA955
MDSLITAAARALAQGDLIGVLNRVALREDPPALALRGIAMAQLGELERAKLLLKTAARGFGQKERVARARCVVAEAEIALVSRDLGWPEAALETARGTLAAHGDTVNAAHARHLAARRLLLVGRLEEAEQMLWAHEPSHLPPALRAAYELTTAGLAIRRIKTGQARAAFVRAQEAAREAGHPALTAEVQHASRVLRTPAARLIAGGEARLVLLEEVEALLASGDLVIDACRHVVRRTGTVISLATRPILFALARLLGEGWPDDVPREALLLGAFRAKETDDSHRARLRVEMGRLRSELRELAEVRATKRGFLLVPREARRLVVLAPPADEPNAATLALLHDGEAWSSSALSIALGASPRTVQRSLEQLAAAGKAQSFGRGPARRWVAPQGPGFPTTLLLPGPLPGRLG